MQANRGARAPRPRSTPIGGFTLIELLVVIAIMGILIGFILVAAQDGVRRSQERATQSLITKLESGVSDRLEAILLQRAEVSLGHQAIAAVANASFTAPSSTSDPNYQLINYLVNGIGYLSYTSGNCVLGPRRAQVIANFDMVRAQMPDVFFVQTSNPSTGQYPINFAGVDFPIGSGNNLVPLGAYSGGSPGIPAANPSTGMSEPGDPNQAIGIYGASFAVAGGIYKNLGYLPQGYDGADNNSDGYVDDWLEGTGTDTTRQAHVKANLAAHTHVTARSEMLYALLVEGGGPMGSVFNRDDFSAREVQDTDGDGLPEFVDAWGNPLQFFRWPIYYNNLSSTTYAMGPNNPSPTGYVQKGSDIYNGPWQTTVTPLPPMEPRQTDPLDPNQTLMAPAWWSSTVNSTAGTAGSYPGGSAFSYSAYLFMNYFHSLIEPNATASSGGGGWWDRSGFYSRRAFYSRPLILSAGPDGVPGVFLFTDAALGAAGGATATAQALVQVENQAAALDISDRSGPLNSQVPSSYGSNTIDLITAGGDDVTNQGLASPTGGVR